MSRLIRRGWMAIALASLALMSACQAGQEQRTLPIAVESSRAVVPGKAHRLDISGSILAATTENVRATTPRGALRLFDAQTGDLLRICPFDDQPFGLAALPDRTFAVGFPNSELVRLVDQNCTELATHQVGYEPWDLTHAYGKLLVGNGGEYDFGILDLNTGNLITVPAADFPIDAVVISESDALIVHHEPSGFSRLGVDGSLNDYNAPFPAARFHTAASDRSEIWLGPTSSGDIVWLPSIENFERIKTINITDRPHDARWLTLQSGLLAVSLEQSGEFVVLDAQDPSQRTTWIVGGMPRFAIWDEDRFHYIDGGTARTGTDSIVTLSVTAASSHK